MSPQPDDAEFLSVKVGTRESTSCSPEVPRDAEGLQIAAPKRVLLSDRPVVPLCATARFASDRRGIPTYLWDRTTLVVVDRDGSELRAAPMGETGGTPATAPPPEAEPATAGASAPEDEDEMIVSGGSYAQWANVDLVEQVGWIARPGPIYAFIVCAGWQSNTVRIEFVPE